MERPIISMAPHARGFPPRPLKDFLRSRRPDSTGDPFIATEIGAGGGQASSGGGKWLGQFVSEPFRYLRHRFNPCPRCEA